MKRVRCPKCDQFVLFDETQYADGQTLVFVCANCQKEFKIRLGVSRLRATQREENRATAPDASPAAADGGKETADWGYITVVENTFAYRQQLPLQEGDNLIGRRNKGTDVDIAIETNDPSMDRRHCYINVRRTGQGRIVYTLRDNNSNTGTFLMNEILGPKDRVPVSSGAVITLGATTLILHTPDEGDEG